MLITDSIYTFIVHCHYCHCHKTQSGLFPSTSSSFISLCSIFLLSPSHDCLQQDYHSHSDHYQYDHYGCRLYQLAAASPACHHCDHLPLHYHRHHHHCRRYQQMIRIFQCLCHFVNMITLNVLHTLATFNILLLNLMFFFFQV